MNRFCLLPLDRARIYRWGQAADVASLVPGSWVRLVLDPAGKEARRVDVGETVEERIGVFAGYDAAGHRLRLTDGTAYPLSSAALITKAGYYLAPQDLAPGERIRLTVLAAPPPWGKIAAGVQVELTPGATPPRLVGQARPQEGGFILSGTTSADRLYLYRATGLRQEVPVGAGGYFASFFRLEQGEETVQLVGLDLAGGGLAGKKITARAGFAGFADIHDHWAAADIAALAKAGLLGGYPDGTFRPANTVVRAELVAALARLRGIRVTPEAKPAFKDAAAIAPWAWAAVAAAQREGLVAGYPDGTFRPAQPVSRAELATLLARLLAGQEPPPASSILPYADLAAIPDWSREAVALTHATGVLRGREVGCFAPLAPVTRGEMAAALNRCRPLLSVPRE
jgi:hypothetical protein